MAAADDHRRGGPTTRDWGTPDRFGYPDQFEHRQQARSGLGAVPSTMAERRTATDTSVGAISQGDMLIAAKQKRMMSASAAAGAGSRRSKAEDDRKINEYNLYM